MPLQRQRPDLPSRLSLAAGCATAAVGAVGLVGWIWDIESLKTIHGPITMKTNAAIGLLLCGTALAALRWSATATLACGSLAGLIGALTLSQHIAGWDLGIDQLLFIETPGAAATASPNRMGPNASTAFLLAGVALALLCRGTARAATAAQCLALLALVLAAVPITGYLYGAEQLYGIARYTGIALHTALGFGLLSAGILMARPGHGFIAVFLDSGPSGILLRRLCLPVVAIPLGLGYLGIYAQSAEIVDRGLGIALYAIALIVVLGATVWHTARAIERSDRARRAAEHERDRLIVIEQDARIELERAHRLKDRFLAMLSHELRTPLNVMLGWTQMLERGRHTSDHTRITAQVAKNGRLLVRLVEDLLDLSRMSAGYFEISRTALVLDAMVHGSIDGLRPAAEDKGITLVADLQSGHEPIEADADRLQQIVWNLLSNAVKFTGPGGRIIVQTSCMPEGVMLIVTDTGIGFDETFAAELFTPFRQADGSASRAHGGLGLGLPIARYIAERHGGSLTGSSAGLGRGSTFTLTLPRAGSVNASLPPRAREESLAVTTEG